MTGRRSIEDLCPSRRAVMRGLVAIGGAALVPGVITACSSDDPASGTAGGADTGSGDADTGADGSGSPATSSIPAADVAVGTAVVVQTADRPVVVAQPSEGEFVAFSAVCTHQGTTVDGGESLVVTCPNHGSAFDLADGAAVVNPPATEPLPRVPVTLDGDQLVLG